MTRIAIFAFAMTLPACLPGPAAVEDGGVDTGGGSGGTGGGGADAGAPDMGSSTPTYTNDILPIVQARCATEPTCHNGGRPASFGSNFVSTYDDVFNLVMNLDAYFCYKDIENPDDPMPMKVGECMVLAAMRGWMPMGAGCDMATRPNPEKCVTPAELDTLMKWVAAGMPKS